MNMTPEQLRQNAAAMLAHADGKSVEARSIAPISEWYVQCKITEWRFDSFEYRPKPEPVTRPWTAKDVPFPCFLTNSMAMREGEYWIVTGVESDGVIIGASMRDSIIEWDELHRAWQHSTDRKTWLPCTVTEG